MQSRKGFTKLELLIVIGIVSVLLMLLIVKIMRAREDARRSQCMGRFGQLVLALHNYHYNNEIFPYGCVGSESLPPHQRWSWFLAIGNFTEQWGEAKIDLQKSWDNPTLQPLQLHTWSNGPLVEYDVNLYAPGIIKCPNGTDRLHEIGQPLNDFVGTAGIGPGAAELPVDSPQAGAWSYSKARNFDDFKDGTANTILAIETHRNIDCWVAGGAATVREYLPQKQLIGKEGQFGGLHPDGCVAVFTDGHVQFLSDEINPEVFAALLTIAGNDEEKRRRPTLTEFTWSTANSIGSFNRGSYSDCDSIG